MPKADRVRFSVTLPADLTARLDAEVGGGTTRADVIRTRLEASYRLEEQRGDALQQQVAHLTAEVQALRAGMEQLVTLLEGMVKSGTPAEPPPVSQPKIATYEDMYGPIDLSHVGPVSTPEASEAAPKKRGWWPW